MASLALQSQKGNFCSDSRLLTASERASMERASAEMCAALDAVMLGHRSRRERMAVREQGSLLPGCVVK